MLRKYTAILFMSLASVIMLAFTVFPHHHHQEYICFEISHCAGENNTASHSHDEEIPSDNGYGCVRNLLQTQISRSQNLEHSCTQGHCHHFTISPFLVADIFQLLSYQAEKKNPPAVFYREKLYSAYCISPLAGRAPPFIG